jgi:DNA-binding transcriptional LysR family regulator
MDIDSLSAFVTTIKEQSFSKAAIKLNLTQPAISKRIQNLESQLSVKLFERLQREIILTEAGEALLPHALNVLHEIDNAKLAIKNIHSSISGQLRIVASHHIGLHRLPLILKNFSKRYPEVDLKLNFLDSESASPLLKDNQADIAFITIPSNMSQDYTCHLVWDDPMSFICGKGHPLSKLNEITPSDLSKHNAILPSETTLTYRVVETIFKQNKVKLKASIPTNYLETMKMMATVDMGWSVLPNTMIDEDLLVLPLSEKFRDSINNGKNKHPVSRKLGAISYRKKNLSNAAKTFIEEAECVWGRFN